MEEKITAILKAVLETDSIDVNSHQGNPDTWDSLRHLMLVSELEDAFGISFEPEEIAEMRSVKDIVNMIGAKQG